MSTAPQGQALKGQALKGQGLQGQGLQGQRQQAQRREADHAPAVRDIRSPGLNWNLDDQLLSGLLGRAPELIA